MSFFPFDDDDYYWEFNPEINSLEMWRKGADGSSIVIDARDLIKPGKINTHYVEIEGWLVADDNYDLWFFPGKDNQPTKENGEWVGMSPIHIKDHGVIQEILKDIPEFTTLRS